MFNIKCLFIISFSSTEQLSGVERSAKENFGSANLAKQ